MSEWSAHAAASDSPVRRGGERTSGISDTESGMVTFSRFEQPMKALWQDVSRERTHAHGEGTERDGMIGPRRGERQPARRGGERTIPIFVTESGMVTLFSSLHKKKAVWKDTNAHTRMGM